MLCEVLIFVLAFFLWGCEPSETSQGSFQTAQSLRGSASGWLQAKPGYKWQFPKDHYQHPGFRTEWWYLTGHLRERGESQRYRFSYQVTFFKVELVANPETLDSDFSSNTVVMAHFAITDSVKGVHQFSESLYRMHPSLAGFGTPPEKRLVWVKAPPGNPGFWSLDLAGEGFAVKANDSNKSIAAELLVMPQKPLVFQGPEGYSQKSPSPNKGSLYYSFTRLKTAGTIKVDGVAYEVHGQSWLDKEIGSNILGENQLGWDWFSLQLSDGRELMLFSLRDVGGGESFVRGTIIAPNGQVSYSQGVDWEVEPVSFWQSSSGGTYPVSWQLKGPIGRYRVLARLKQQENISKRVMGLKYWEGAVDVFDHADNRVGVGFLEMTGR